MGEDNMLCVGGVSVSSGLKTLQELKVQTVRNQPPALSDLSPAGSFPQSNDGQGLQLSSKYKHNLLTLRCVCTAAAAAAAAGAFVALLQVL